MSHSEGWDDLDKDVAEAKQRRILQPYRFWVAKGESKEVSFIDDRAFSFREHNFEKDGRWGNHEVCVGADKGCPWCLAGNNYYRPRLFTIMDHSSYTNKKNEVIADQIKILAIKEDQALLLRNLMQQLGGLKGKRLTVSRSNGKNSPTWGESFTPTMINGELVKTDWSQFDPKILRAFDYEAIYVEKPIDVLKRIYHGSRNSNYAGKTHAVGGGGAAHPAGNYPDDIPF